VSASKPKLVAVENRPADQADAPPPQPQPSRSGRWIQLGLVVAAVTAASVAVWQTQRVDALSGQVESLEVELGAAQAALGAYEQRFGEIRTSVGELQAQLGELEALVETSPASRLAP
jgi:hypothetical protein